MNIPKQTLSEAVKDFKATGICSSAYLIRKFKISHEMATKITQYIEQKYPNLWKKAKEGVVKEKK